MRAIRRRYYAGSKEKIKHDAAAWQLAHPDKRAPIARRYREKTIGHQRERSRRYGREHAAEIAERNRQHRQANLDLYRVRSRAYKERIKGLKPKKPYPILTAVKNAKRKALRLSAPGNGVSTPQWRQVVEGSCGICAYCNDRKPLTLDHIDPLFFGGAHDVSNVAAACKSCNSAKRNLTLIYWLAQRARERQIGVSL